MSNITKLTPVEIGDGFRFDPNVILEEAKGQLCGRMVVIGETLDGEIWVSGSANVGETLLLMEMAKRVLVP